ncbi:hypothetical protein [Candidatus Nitrospira allomarina]|uniref:Uncharacterized protein n=1 Tax=Candidatus Nitrospira allomarina TaxID=3020900 RepID=A0AA96GA47_9BACT|nr:hypothetical protein [Candidatus Nitrospira allomarina]WNM57983.1 hypothetical protein PP769_18735 [Candidatus Nitrospira allomarina]
MHAALAMVVTDLSGVLHNNVNEFASGSQVPSFVFHVSSPSDNDFGYVKELPGLLTFNSVVSSENVPDPVDFGVNAGIWSFSDDVVNIGLKPNLNAGSIFLISEGLGTLEFLQQVSGIDVNFPGITPYFNTLQIAKNIPFLDFGQPVFHSGGQLDGLAVAPVHIPPVALLVGSGIIGLIVIARRSLFVR